MGYGSRPVTPQYLVRALGVHILGSYENRKHHWYLVESSTARILLICFISSQSRYLSNTYYVPGVVLGAWNITVNKKDKNACLHGAYFLVFLCTCISLLCVCTQSDPTLCSPLDYTLPGSSVPGILQARILEWVAISSCRGSSRPRDCTRVSCISCISRSILYH